MYQIESIAALQIEWRRIDYQFCFRRKLHYRTLISTFSELTSFLTVGYFSCSFLCYHFFSMGFRKVFHINSRYIACKLDRDTLFFVCMLLHFNVVVYSYWHEKIAKEKHILNLWIPMRQKKKKFIRIYAFFDCQTFGHFLKDWGKI